MGRGVATPMGPIKRDTGIPTPQGTYFPVEKKCHGGKGPIFRSPHFV